MPNKQSGQGPACVATGTACPVVAGKPPKDFACSEPANCAAGSVCCAAGQLGVGACAQVSMFQGTSCKAACAAAELVVCQQQSDCASGTTCTAVGAGGAPMGVCR